MLVLPHEVFISQQKQAGVFTQHSVVASVGTDFSFAETAFSGSVQLLDRERDS